MGKIFEVDLSHFEEPARSEIKNNLEKSAWDIYPVIDNPNLITVMWDDPAPIEQLFPELAHCIRPVL